MEEIPVIIVGAGPSGLVLGLSLAQDGIHVCPSIQVPHKSDADAESQQFWKEISKLAKIREAYI